MTKCLECGYALKEITNDHLNKCCGLTLHEYALRHNIPLDILLSEEKLNIPIEINDYQISSAFLSRKSRLILSALDFVGGLSLSHDFVEIQGEVRRLDQLLWYLRQLRECHFEFKQEYKFNHKTHRVVAYNCLRARSENIRNYQISLEKLSITDLLLFVSIAISINSFCSAGYIFIPCVSSTQGKLLSKVLNQYFKVRFVELKPKDNNFEVLLRTEMCDDATNLINLVKHRLTEIPLAYQHFRLDTPIASVTKELSFDSAHFITDHPGACSNMHGGRYNLLVTIKDHIDSYTGFVMDYGYLKRVVKEHVIDLLDHAHLNLVDKSLSWRSSTELLSIFIWEQLIDYVPSLTKIKIYETQNSYCTFKGPSLEEWQSKDKCIMPSHFGDKNLGKSDLRKENEILSPPFRLIGTNKFEE